MINVIFMLKLELWKNCFAKNSLNLGALLCFFYYALQSSSMITVMRR